MSKRVGLKPVTRFEVFKRDLFVCQYCGGKPPAVVLEVDHVNPVANGGGNDIDNLLTACQGCNRGKAARLLTDVPATIIERAELLKERQLQMAEYEKLLKKERRRIERDVERVGVALGGGFSILSEDARSSVRRFLGKLPTDTVVEFGGTAYSRLGDTERAFKYFCGMCWTAIKEPRR